ncbi:MAG: endonuclease/exonuclease/phosphatase family protein [Archangiaceae bacterium]|nr:endonuclease/exonuclease/phosphatase family protein [Archangiaceae bacterium]
MSVSRVITWNVLHRVHGEKWSKHVTSRYPDEAARIARITDQVRRWLGESIEVVCLQEVSGDQLASLRAAGLTVHSHRYPRVPRHWRFWSRPLTDASEHLATVTAAEAAVAASQTFARDLGKGLLAVDIGALRVVNTHLTFGALGLAQLKQAANAAGSGRALLMGDLNADQPTVSRLLPRFALAVPGVSTRLAASHRGGLIVDHIAVRDGSPEAASVIELEPLSDHLPVSATVRWEPRSQ